ncbi:copper-binding protein [Paenibacillus sp. 598K]|uniref:copper ion binding protein n=1 Tax=Paenibacillus sp. 598K TaxID=1117987 RepID=UPI000FFACFC0|nr:copper ion binding protein [Paenibacillus sp. 598K]GBF75206.1 copper-binding protein [Paenibacillus sp. 598K]
MKTISLTVSGMSCGHCVSAIEKALKEINVDSQVDLASGTVQVSFDESKQSLAAIQETIEDQGYEVQ